MHSAKLASPDVAFEFFEIEPPTICVLLVNQFRRPEIKQSISPLIIDYLISAASGTKNVNFSGGFWESGIFLELRNGKTNVALQFRLCTVKYWTVLGTGQHCTVQSWVLSRTDYSTAQYSRWCYVAKVGPSSPWEGGEEGWAQVFLGGARSQFLLFLGAHPPTHPPNTRKSYGSNEIQSPITRENDWPADSLNNNNYFLFNNSIIPFHWVLDCSQSVLQSSVPKISDEHFFQENGGGGSYEGFAENNKSVI